MNKDMIQTIIDEVKEASPALIESSDFLERLNHILFDDYNMAYSYRNIWESSEYHMEGREDEWYHFTINFKVYEINMSSIKYRAWLGSSQVITDCDEGVYSDMAIEGELSKEATNAKIEEEIYNTLVRLITKMLSIRLNF